MTGTKGSRFHKKMSFQIRLMHFAQRMLPVLYLKPACVPWYREFCEFGVPTEEELHGLVVDRLLKILSVLG